MRHHRMVVVLLTGWMALSSLALGGDADPAWKTVRGVTRKNSDYTAFSRDGRCANGRITALSDKAVTIQPDKGAAMTFAKDELLRVSDGTGPQDIVYTGRSSWFDVRQLPDNDVESVRVVMRDGHKHQAKCRQVKTTEEGITLGDAKRPRTLAKKDVAAVHYIRVKPLTDGESNALHEYIIFHPIWWVSMCAWKAR